MKKNRLLVTINSLVMDIKKKKCFFAFIGIVFLAVILRMLGFRITYDPKMDDNWEAVSACGTWFCGCIVPIAVLFLQHRINESEKKMSASNVALLEEVNIVKTQSNNGDSVESYVSPGEIYRYICIKMVASTTEIAEHFGVKPENIKSQLEDLWAVQELISTVSLEDDPNSKFEQCNWKKS